MPEKKSFSFSYLEYGSIDQLGDDDQELVKISEAAAAKAYAPYSKFMVGAAIRLESGKVVSGANVENAAFPSGTCAEKNALAYSVANYPDDAPVAIAITALHENGEKAESVSPCGNCRQFIAEEEMRTRRKIKIILSEREKIMVIDTISDLLPLQFNKNSLGDHSSFITS
jgi:cytidine deaminase